MKKFSFIWLFVLMSICVIGANAEGEVAQIGETKYATVAEAFANVQDGETIELLSNASFDNVVSYNGDEISFTLDGNGYTLTATESITGWDGGPQGSIRVLKAHITVCNITLTQENPDAKGFFEVRNNLGSGKSSLEISDNVTFTANGGPAIQCSRAQSNRPELIISGSNVLIEGYSEGINANHADITITGEITISAGDSATNGIYLNEGKLDAEEGTVEISGFRNGIVLNDTSTNVILGENTAIKNSTALGIDVVKGTLDFNGLVKDCPTGINASDGTLKVSGGTIENCERGIGVKKEKSVIVGGEANLTDNDSNIVLGEGSKIILEEDFCGTIGIVGSENQAGTAFGEISEDLNGIVENVFNDENTELVACASEGKLLWKKMATVTIEDFEAKTYGDASFEVVLENADDFSDFTYSSSDPDVASVSDSGIITIYKAGETDIAVEFGGNDTYAPATDVKTLTIAKLAITITADNSFKIKGESDPEFTYTYTPELVEGEKLEVKEITP
ncbi:MAG: hypothetical protein Q4G23_12100, partial [Clostridia bacterium]|nr:hypothetical protein [Clostridia bacterium]